MATKPAEMLLLIDNYDSFTYNLVHLLADVGLETQVVRNDAMSVAEIVSLTPEAVILSPGPKDPDHAGICMPLVRASQGKIPIFGVCLGCQVVAQAFGARIIRAPQPVHGKTDSIRHDGSDMFAGVEDGFTATRYHSLIVDADSLPPQLVATAFSGGAAPRSPQRRALSCAAGRTGGDILMALRHREWPVFGVQFHPESIASEYGQRILANFAAISGIGGISPS